jgi:hypothetical protein
MKAQQKKEAKMVTVSEEALLSLVAHKLKGRVLFPKKLEEAKAHLKNAKISFS